jgi:hypothetical protein
MVHMVVQVVRANYELTFMGAGPTCLTSMRCATRPTVKRVCAGTLVHYEQTVTGPAPTSLRTMRCATRPTVRRVCTGKLYTGTL